MKHIKITLMTMVVLFTIFSCSNPKKELTNSIATLEKELATTQSLDSKKALEIISLYQEFAKLYPTDTASATMLYKSAEIEMNIQMPNEAIVDYDQILTKYPNFNKLAECLFLKGFVYENLLGDLNNAEKYYRQFLQEYPNHPLAKDAEASIKFLGKTPEELVEIFQKMNE